MRQQHNRMVLEERSFITMFLGTPNWWYSLFTDDISLLSCPQTFLQAMADRGRFMLDEYCHQDAEQHCALYRKEATHCFSTNNPRWICIFDTQELENMLNLQKWVYVSRLSRLLCSKKKIGLVYYNQARMLIAYLLPSWEGRTEFMKKEKRFSRPSQPTSVNKHVSIWSPFLLLPPFLWHLTGP